MIKLLGTAALFCMGLIIGYEAGRFHRSPYDMALALQYRIEEWRK